MAVETKDGSHIPVVDFSEFSMTKPDVDLTSGEAKEVARRIVEAFSDIGFVYLSHCGVSADQIQKTFNASSEFFRLPTEVKAKYKARKESFYQGYFAPGDEAFDPDAPGDMKETFDFNMANMESAIWPDELPNFKNTLMGFFEENARLTERILRLLALGLELSDPEYFVRCHNFMTMKRPYGTTFRTLYYPPVTCDELQDGQTRLGEHTDYGTITLLFQDNAGGLQVRDATGEWVDAVPIEDTVVVNIADLLQRWTSDRLVSTGHRIVAPKDCERKCAPRQSLVFFVQPDPEVEITCIDGSNKYEPVKSGDYLRKRILETTPNFNSNLSTNY